MENEHVISNPDVPAETLLKWQSRELVKLRKILARKEKTIERLKNNIRMLLNDEQVKLQVACDARVREYARNMSNAQYELHRVRKSQEKILQTLLNYQLRENDRLQ